MMVKNFKKFLIGFIAMIVLPLAMGFQSGGFMWEYKGKVADDVFPAAGGKMRVEGDGRFYIFDPRTPAAVELAPYDESIPVEDYKPQYKEEWMSDTAQQVNRKSIRLLESFPNRPTNVLFQEYGQRGFWWVSKDLSTIYILVQWHDYTKEEPTNLSFWRSEDHGKTFIQVDLKAQGLGLGQAAGMYFDNKGQHGYIFVDKDILWQTNDSGQSWKKRTLPRSNQSELFSTYNGIDCAQVDHQGNLLLSLFHKDEKTGKLESQIFEIPANNELSNLSAVEPRYALEGYRILTLNAVPGKNGFYISYIKCKDGQECILGDEITEMNPALNVAYLEGSQIKSSYTFDFEFLPVKELFTGENGRLAIILEMPNYWESKLLVSQDYGKTWSVTDITEHEVISHFVDFTKGKYWQYRRYNKMYVGKLF